MTTARTLALEVLSRIEQDDAYSHIALSNQLASAELDMRDRALATELVYGTLARQRSIDTVLSRFVSRKLDRLDMPVRLNLRMAAYQLIYLDRIPAHALVNDAVKLVKRACGQRTAGFANAVLRNMLRSKHKWAPFVESDRTHNPARYLGLKHSLPDWIASRLLDRHGLQRAEELAEAFAGRPPLYLRELANGVELPEGVRRLDAPPGALRAESSSPELRSLLEAHRLTIQDLGSQLIAHYCGAHAGQRVLDACCGLGGKSLLLASQLATGDTLVACDPLPSKLEMLANTLAALPIEPTVVLRQTTLQQLPAADGNFDVILVDAPCSGLGVIRRHPETRWRRSPADVDSLAELQTELLDHALQRLNPGGTLIYSVCTFTREEGPQQIERLLKRHPRLERAPLPERGFDWSPFVNERQELDLNPHDHDCDAFFAARVRLRST
ncbi:16S rRNA (cytosine(967)-C(5))-methyltransferase RsmB [Lujinxingia litoralis]|uniref:16S rRNA (Cytosine(967)-C(5))-methyltransferase RsmB n=1 Tax=Lujinxingia litoralis TaxID=2211119 RepID=A0A328C0R9_9DELT|nr:16S rRNA (cytosine(967)-C(5))-methyltransferase RsmB [Lujinxingia litoralis]RAL20178.1 16S rRNA (cytosine(967)-C(5))-methyltransferase RsmB [Lujinxingia litoralis]